MLLEFYGEECPHCIRMKPLIERLEKEEGVTVTSHEVWHNKENAKKLASYDKGLCGGVPFFFNTETGAYICGEAEYDEVKKWAAPRPVAPGMPTPAELKAKLTPEQYHIVMEKGTEAPFTGKYYKTHDKGMYQCVVCGTQLFSSDTKFDSGSGWPSFDKAIPGATKLVSDGSHGMERTEVVCNTCGAHLGHVFSDGPTETGQRFCINSASLDLKADK